MRVIVTGAFGNVGLSTLNELVQQGHSVRCFDRKTRLNERRAKAFAGATEVVWGDLRQPGEVAAAVQDQDVIIHLAFIIPPQIDENLDFASAVNVEGTQNLIDAAKKMSQPAKMIFASSFNVYGFTQDQIPPRKVTDPVYPTSAYTKHKITCEQLLRASGLAWSIYRFANVPPLAASRPHPIMFTIPLDTRMELVHTHDVGLALARGVSHDLIWGKILLIGGGQSCQVRYRDFLCQSLRAAGLDMLPEDAFGNDPYPTDWLDTEESQRLLAYQRHSFADIIRDISKANGPIRFVLPLFRPLIEKQMLKLSPYRSK